MHSAGRAKALVSIIVSAVFSMGVPSLARHLDPTESNVFTPPQEVVVPSYSESMKGRDRLQQLLGNDIPSFQQIKMIPSLTAKQREQLRVLYEGARVEIQPMLDELKIMKDGAARGASPKGLGKGGGSSTATVGGEMQSVPASESMRSDEGEATGGLAGDGRRILKQLAGDVEKRQRAIAILNSLKEKRARVWKEAQTMLTGQQIEQLDKMRRGELMGRNLVEQ